MGRRLYTRYMGACSEMRLPRSLSLSQSMSPFSGALDSALAAAAAPAPARARRGLEPAPWEAAAADVPVSRGRAL